MIDYQNKLYQCSECGCIFSENDADTMEIDLEAENGVGGLFPDHHYTNINICPDCGCDELMDYIEEEEEEEEDD